MESEHTKQRRTTKLFNLIYAHGWLFLKVSIFVLFHFSFSSSPRRRARVPRAETIESLSTMKKRGNSSGKLIQRAARCKAANNSKHDWISRCSMPRESAEFKVNCGLGLSSPHRREQNIHMREIFQVSTTFTTAVSFINDKVEDQAMSTLRLLNFRVFFVSVH